MTQFKLSTFKGCSFSAYEEPNCISIIITPLKEDIYKPCFIFNLPKTLYSYIKGLSANSFVVFCLNLTKDSYSDFSKLFNL